MSDEINPAPRIELMRQSLDAARKAPRPAGPPNSDAPPLIVPSSIPTVEMTESKMYSMFRADMKAAGLVPYEVEDVHLGRDYRGPGVNVRDPNQARAATSLTLATHAIRSNLWRLYPVLTPVQI